MTGAALVDAHCHFDLFPNPQKVLREAEERRIYSIGVTNAPSVFEPMARLAKGLDYVRPALGLHPELAIERASELPLFALLVAKTKYVGEVGLDYKAVVRPADRLKQRSIFETILKVCAEAGGKILTIHSRRAEADVIAALKAIRPGPSILHWYSGSLQNLRAAVDAGAYFSVNVAMTRSDRGRRLIQEMPRDRILTESDGPFVELRGRAASPASVRESVGALAGIFGREAEEIQESVLSNFQALLQSQLSACSSR